MTRHSLERTNPMGQKFIGTCRLCGTSNLPMSAALDECPNQRGLSEEEALIEAIERPPMTTPSEVPMCPWCGNCNWHGPHCKVCHTSALDRLAEAEERIRGYRKAIQSDAANINEAWEADRARADRLAEAERERDDACETAKKRSDEAYLQRIRAEGAEHKLAEVTALYNAGCAQWGPVYKEVLERLAETEARANRLAKALEETNGRS